MYFFGFLNAAGALSCSIGGILALVSVLKGREARQLAGARNLDSLAELHQLIGLVPLLIAVTGRVFSERPLKCELSDSEGVIVEFREERKSERRQNNYWYTDVVPLRESLKETDWCLQDASRAVLPVQGGRNADGDYLQISGDQWQDASPGGAVAQVATQMIGNRPLGVRKVERYLPVGTVLTAVGELAPVPDQTGAFKGALRSGGKMFVLREPGGGGRPFRLSRQPLPELIASLQDTSQQCSYLAKVFTGVGAGLLLVSLSHKLWVLYRQRKMRQRVERARRARAGGAAAAAAGREAGDVDADRAGGSPLQQATCVICLDRQSEMVFRCGHLCTCGACAAGLRRCPICRAAGAPIRVYVS